MCPTRSRGASPRVAGSSRRVPRTSTFLVLPCPRALACLSVPGFWHANPPRVRLRVNLPACQSAPLPWARPVRSSPCPHVPIQATTSTPLAATSDRTTAGPPVAASPPPSPHRRAPSAPPPPSAPTWAPHLPQPPWCWCTVTRVYNHAQRLVQCSGPATTRFSGPSAGTGRWAATHFRRLSTHFQRL